MLFYIEDCSTLFSVLFLSVTISVSIFNIDTFLHLCFIIANSHINLVFKTNIISLTWERTAVLQDSCNSFKSKSVYIKLSLYTSLFISIVLLCTPFDSYFKLDHSIIMLI
jgi:hypothetical protein